MGIFSPRWPEVATDNRGGVALSPDAIEALEELYARVPKLQCKQKCQSCCEPFRIGRAEWERIEQRTGPLRVLDRKLCPMLDSAGRCTVYDIRPMLCRIWYCIQGDPDRPPCPHGCVPDRWLSKEEALDLLYQANAISRHEFAGPCVQMERFETAMNQFFAGVTE